jgi:hypothetical protein
MYRACIKIKVGSAMTTTHVLIEAQSASIAKALLQQQYGQSNIINVVPK